MRDPMERMIAEALDAAGIAYVVGAANPTGMDFWLPGPDLYIEVKQFHAARIARQMARAPNVIAVQGRGAVEALAALIRTAGAGWISSPRARSEPVGRPA